MWVELGSGSGLGRQAAGSGGPRLAARPSAALGRADSCQERRARARRRPPPAHAAATPRHGARVDGVGRAGARRGARGLGGLQAADEAGGGRLRGHMVGVWGRGQGARMQRGSQRWLGAVEDGAVWLWVGSAAPAPPAHCTAGQRGPRRTVLRRAPRLEALRRRRVLAAGVKHAPHGAQAVDLVQQGRARGAARRRAGPGQRHLVCGTARP
jgi:hypothetical protein